MTSAPAPLRVSIIIPSYKALATLEKAVRSVLAQTETRWELLIIDDCSPDATGEEVERLAQLDPRIRAIRLPENHGKPYVMNYGTSLAQAPWVALLDCDDWYAPTRLQRLLDAAEAAAVPMAADNQVFYDAKAKAEAGVALPDLRTDKIIGLDDFLASSNAAASFDFGMLKPIFRTDFWRAHKLAYFEPARIGEDYLILLEFFAKGGTGVLVAEPLYYYLQPFGTISRQWAQEGRRQYNFALLETINAHGMAQVKAALTADQFSVLQRRGASIAALARLERLRQAAREKDIAGALQQLLAAPPAFWQLLGRRIAGKLRRA